MVTFLIGLAILFIGGGIYGAYCEKVFSPDDRQTPAVLQNDGVDFVPMPKWKNSLIELLNIAGTGPILGPIQGILFGPIAFILIPLGCVLGGALHDYMSGMISLRCKGEQMPALIKKFLGQKIFPWYNAFVCLLMLLVGAVFIYTPGDLFVTGVLHSSSDSGNYLVWVVYGIIFLYYLIATLFPIDKIIGTVYPVFGAILLLSVVGIFIGLFTHGYSLDNLTAAGILGCHPKNIPLLPVFFVTVACGIVSGFHSTQATLIGRSVKNEREGRMTFFNMMLLEGFIAMVWAAAAMGIYNQGIAQDMIGKPGVIGLVANDLLGGTGGMIAIIGVVVLSITSGDTALRALRLMLGDFLKIDQTLARNRLLLSGAIFSLVAAILVFAKLSAEGFNILWRYFAWSNQTIAIFAFAMIAIYLFREKRNYLIAVLPGMFYTFIISSYILYAKIGFNLPIGAASVLGVLLAGLYGWATIHKAKSELADKIELES